MYSSLHLIRKDFMLTRKFLLLMVPYYLLMGYLNAEAYTVFSLFPALLLLINSCTIDMQHHNQKFLVTLPVPRQRLILAKYLMLIPFSLFSLICTLVLYVFAFKIGKLDAPLRWRELGLTTAIFPLIASFYLPVYYWLGQKGMQIVNMVFMLLVMLNFSALTSLSERYPDLALWMKTGKFDNVLLVGIVILAYLVIIYGSYLLSLRIFVKKDI
ncbi:ABC-2 transporter permease [Paenibacillus tritici]|uniref:ABC-2 transporter permease n=1 Tax=Paenibacillus tritici TaxID=1873425 RepID=UPI001BADF74F|nr:ABC-2 transporter permease [Paenibacillus tritici]QUL52308.1 ABC-2 transporter permease [Paenibacillus tritici]